MSNETDLKGLYPFLHGKQQDAASLDAALLHSVKEKARESRATNDGKPTVVWDLFRVEAGAVAEHWITYEEIPAHMAHGNGMF